jgi:hypothetical protein
MQSGFFQRAAVAIVLMGALLAPFGTCLQRTQHTAHSCCSHASQAGKTAKPDCCTVSNQSPVAMVAPAFAGSAPMVISRVFLSASELSSPREVPAAAIIPQHSPPGRASILRI